VTGGMHVIPLTVELDELTAPILAALRHDIL
jgi:hypothetical protein